MYYLIVSPSTKMQRLVADRDVADFHQTAGYIVVDLSAEECAYFGITLI
jgi:hypothetical protein